MVTSKCKQQVSKLPLAQDVPELQMLRSFQRTVSLWPVSYGHVLIIPHRLLSETG